MDETMETYKGVSVDEVIEYLQNKICFNCGGSNLKCYGETTETKNTVMIIMCEDCRKAIKCDFLDGIKM